MIWPKASNPGVGQRAKEDSVSIQYKWKSQHNKQHWHITVYKALSHTQFHWTLISPKVHSFLHVPTFSASREYNPFSIWVFRFNLVLVFNINSYVHELLKYTSELWLRSQSIALISRQRHNTQTKTILEDNLAPSIYLYILFLLLLFLHAIRQYGWVPWYLQITWVQLIFS